MSDSRNVEAAPRTYDFLLEHHWQDHKTFPTPEALEEAVSALGGVEEFMIDNILRGVAKTVTAEDCDSLTDEQIGRLVVWADHVHDTAKRIAESAELVSFLARQSYVPGDELPVNEGAYVIDQNTYRRLWAAMVGAPTDA